MPIRLKRCNVDVYQIWSNDQVVALAERLANDRWCLCDTQDRPLLPGRTFSMPADACQAYLEAFGLEDK